MLIRFFISALALAAAAPAFAQSGSVRDFQLPPDPESTATPEVQGPVDPEAPVPTTPRVIPTDTPTPRPTARPTPAPTPTRAPLQLPPQPTPTPAQRAPSAAQPAPEAAQQGPSQDTAPPAQTPVEEPSTSSDSAFDFAPPPTVPVPESAATAPEEGGSLIPWLAALLAALGAAGAGYWFLRRREELAPVPAIEPPLARREPQPGPEPRQAPEPAPAPAPQSETAARAPSLPPPQPTPAPAESVSLGAQPVRFSRSMMNAIFAYRVVLENHGRERWEDLAIEADLVTAHGAAPIAEQLADTAVPLAPMRTIPALAAGETIEVAGSVQLPLSQVRAIAQGRAAVYVPLLRLRVAAKGKAPLARTYLVGQLPDRAGGNLQPFRLDEMPQSYGEIGMRPLD